MSFQRDLTSIKNRLPKELQCFGECYVEDNGVLFLFGNDEFVAFAIKPNGKKLTNGAALCTLKLRTRTMAATWENVPETFTRINQMKGLMAEVRRAVTVSHRENIYWYVMKQLTDKIGDRFHVEHQDRRLTRNKNDAVPKEDVKNLCNIEFVNHRKVFVETTRNPETGRGKPELIQNLAVKDEQGNVLRTSCTADECVLMLQQEAGKVDPLVDEFLEYAETHDMQARIQKTYRTVQEDLDDVIAAKAGFALQLRLVNGIPYVTALKTVTEQDGEKRRIPIVEDVEIEDRNALFSFLETIASE